MWMLEESERDAAIVWHALRVTPFDEAAITEVICSRTPSQLCNIQRAYLTKFSSQLLQEINSSNASFFGHHKELLTACLDDQARDHEGTNVDLKLAEIDAKQLYKDGEKLWGMNEKTFIDIFTKRSRPHLAAVDAAYNELYGHSLEAVLKETYRSLRAGLLMLLRCAKNPAKYFAEAYKTTVEDAIRKNTWGGGYRTFLLLVVDTPTPEGDAANLYRAFKGKTCDVGRLVQFLFKRDPTHRHQIAKHYKKSYHEELSDRIYSELSTVGKGFLEEKVGVDLTIKATGSLRWLCKDIKLLVACLDDKASDGGTNVDVNKAKEDATQFYKDGEKIWGTNNKTFIDIFTKRNRPLLAAVDAAYEKLYSHSLGEVLYNSMKGLGTSDTTLLRVVVTRAGIDLEDIKNEYVQAYETSLKDCVHKETSGDYRTFLLNLLELPKGVLLAVDCLGKWCWLAFLNYNNLDSGASFLVCGSVWCVLRVV
ncbi:hypothetical protein MRB53_008587 [Persea americana]|uniref:Uncharacterized protein n=1 Tax=Persea americana TaxID=3435 RepID=A0ACC2MM52_PERAE|nr:hypothetical protein MRB53_008587 [Persea americana]